MLVIVWASMRPTYASRAGPSIAVRVHLQQECVNIKAVAILAEEPQEIICLVLTATYHASSCGTEDVSFLALQIICCYPVDHLEIKGGACDY